MEVVVKPQQQMHMTHQNIPDDTSLQVFRRFIRYLPNGGVDTSAVLSKGCYRKWLQTRRVEPGKPEESFRRVLTAHVRGSDGRKPFHREEEVSLLLELRQKRVWPCFSDTNSRIGINGFRAVGYHERKDVLKNDVNKGAEAYDCGDRGKAVSKITCAVMDKKNSAEKPSNTNAPLLPDIQILPKQNGTTCCVSVTNEINSNSTETTKQSPKNKMNSKNKLFDKYYRHEGRSKFLSSYEVFVMFAPADERFIFLEYKMFSVCGRDGRRPFPADLEPLVVAQIRKKQTWPCFKHRTERHVLNIGKKGFRHMGFHEAKRHSQRTPKANDVPRNNISMISSNIDRFQEYNPNYPGSKSNYHPGFSQSINRGSMFNISNINLNLNNNIYLPNPILSFPPQMNHAGAQDQMLAMRNDSISTTPSMVAGLSPLSRQNMEPKKEELAGLLNYFSNTPTVLPKNTPNVSVDSENVHSGFNSTLLRPGTKRSTHSMNRLLTTSKRPRLALPKFYVNCIDDEKNLNDITCYDPNKEKLLTYDVERRKELNAQDSAPDIHSPNSNDSPSILNLQVDDSAWQQITEENISLCADSLRDMHAQNIGNVNEESLRLPEIVIPGETALECDETSVLDTFEDVSSEEVIKVIQLRKLTATIYGQYFQDIKYKHDEWPTDVCGDVKLLRTLRLCKGNVVEAVKEVQCFLTWRKRYNLEQIREKIIDNNMSFEKLKAEFTIGKRGGCYPFFSQDDNGDITDIWVLQKQTDVDDEEMKSDLLSHIKLNEFRSIVLDRLSYVKRRVVCFKIIYDWTIVKDQEVLTPNEEIEPQGGEKFLDWWAVLKKWEQYVKTIIDMYTRWYGGSCSRCHVFGTGHLFKVMTSTVIRKCFGVMIGDSVNLVGKPEEYEKVLRKSLGEQSQWPTFIAGGGIDPEHTELTKKKLSTFGRPKIN